MGRREDVEGMRGGVCEHAHAQMGACGARACAPPLRTPSRGGAAMGTREALVQSRSRRCKRALPSRGGADGGPYRAAHRCRRAACARVCQHDLEPVDCLTQAIYLGILACKVGRSCLCRAQQTLLLPRAKSGVATRFAPLRRVCLFVCGWPAPARHSSYRARERPPCGRTRKAAQAACTEYNMMQQVATGCNVLRPSHSMLQVSSRRLAPRPREQAVRISQAAGRLPPDTTRTRNARSACKPTLSSSAAAWYRALSSSATSRDVSSACAHAPACVRACG